MNSFDLIALSVGNVLVGMAFVLALAFVVLYQLLARWEKSAFGIQTMISSLGFMALLGLGIWTIFFGDRYPGRLVVRDIITLGVCAMLAWRIYLLLGEQIRGRRNNDPTKKEDSSNDR